MSDLAKREDMHRRQFLGVVCGGGVAVAGCLGFGGTNETVGVSVENEDSAARKITVRVVFGGEQLLTRTVTVEPGETATMSFPNPDSAGDATVTATAATGTKTSKSVRIGPGTGIRSITVIAAQDGSLRIVAART